MKIAFIIISVLLVVAVLWIVAMYAEKKNLLKDEDNDYIPDVIEDKVSDIKDSVNQKIDNTKKKIKNVKKAIKE